MVSLAGARRIGELETFSDRKVTVYCHQNNGLANRFKNIFSAHRLFKKEDIEVFWYTDFVFKYAKLNEYFPDLVETETVAGKEYRQGWRLVTLPEDVPQGFSNKNELYNKFFGHYPHPIIRNGKAIDFEFERIPENVKEEYRKIIGSIRIADHILEAADSFASKNFDDETVSVHIRAFKDSADHQRMFFSSERICEKMDKYPDSKFFVTTDSPEVIPQLKELYGDNRIITREQNNPMFDGFIDMLSVSKNNTIIGSPWSTFSEMAWWFGGAKAKMEVAWKEDEWYN